MDNTVATLITGHLLEGSGANCACGGQARPIGSCLSPTIGKRHADSTLACLERVCADTACCASACEGLQVQLGQRRRTKHLGGVKAELPQLNNPRLS
jgi:hypothetical protein